MHSTGDRVGSVLAGRYRVDTLLGEGGFGAVYAGVDLESGREVALKCLHAHLGTDANVVARFRREARAASAIGHPGIVQVYDFCAIPDGGHTIVMERLNGEDLGELLARRGPLGVGEICRILIDVCDALAAAHEAGIVHRDLKPDNLFLPRDPQAAGARVKLLDFGISKFLPSAEGAGATLMTKTGAALGTPYFMSPEQAQGKKTVGARSDLYALGVILFRALSDQHPFEDDSYPLLIVKICTEDAPSLRQFRMDVPARLDALLQRLLAKDPEDRPADCREVQAALTEFADHDVAPVTTPTEATRDRVPAALRSRPGGMAAAPAIEHGDDELSDEHARVLAGGRSRLRWLFALVAAALCIGAGALVFSFLGSSTRRAREEVPLPEPTAPQRAPLSAPTPTALGWRYEHPLPRAMPTWSAVAVAGPGRAAMVGRAGAVARVGEGRIQRWESGTSEDLFSLAWMGEDTLYVGGAGGSLQRLRPDGAESVSTPLLGSIRDLLATSATELVGVGDSGTMFRVRAGALEMVPTGREETLFGVASFGDALFAVGQRGLILRIEGDDVSVERRARHTTLRAVGGCPHAPLYAVGDEGALLRRNRRGRWRSVPGAPRASLTDVSCHAASGGAVVVTTDEGDALLVSGDRFVTLDGGEGPAGELAFRGASSVPDGPTWLVGDGGRLALVAEDHLVLLTDGVPRTLHAATELDGELYVVGEWGTILHEDALGPGGFRALPCDTDAALADIVGLAPGVALAVGDRGAIVRVSGGRGRALPRVTQRSLRGVIADRGWVVAVGAEGVVLRGAPDALQESRVDGVGLLADVAGDADSALAVGDAGALVRLTRLSAQRLPCEAARGLALRAVSRVAAEGDVFIAVAAGGEVLRISGDTCVRERVEEPGGAAAAEPRWAALGRGPGGELIAIGARGAAMRRVGVGEETGTGEGHWEVFDIGVGMNLFGLARTQRDVWLVGAGGLILRHPRVDEGATSGSGRAPAGASSG